MRHRAELAARSADDRRVVVQGFEGPPGGSLGRSQRSRPTPRTAEHAGPDGRPARDEGGKGLKPEARETRRGRTPLPRPEDERIARLQGPRRKPPIVPVTDDGMTLVSDEHLDPAARAEPVCGFDPRNAHP